MRKVVVAFLAVASLSIGLAVPGAALAKQSAEPPSTTGIDASRPLRLPSSLFQIKFGDQGGQTAPPAKEIPAQGPVPAPKPAYANQAAQPFQPAKITKVIQYGLVVTFYEHVMRVATESFTREQLVGKFWPDYFDSVNKPTTWGDTDGWKTNVIGHAISGGAFTRIWMEQREAKATTTSQYLKSMGRAFVYTAIFSVQFEIGPMSEASIGNVGMDPATSGWTDFIWTPIGGVLWTMAEDAIDKYALVFIDKHVPFTIAKVAARLILNPSRLLANIGQNRTPWNRPDRTINGEPIKR